MSFYSLKLVFAKEINKQFIHSFIHSFIDLTDKGIGVRQSFLWAFKARWIDYNKD